MKQHSILFLILAIAFVGTTSCGDDNKSAKDAELAYLRQRLAQQGSGTPVVINAYSTVTSTSISNVTYTSGSTTSGSTSSGIVVIYTVTNGSTSTTTGTGGGRM